MIKIVKPDFVNNTHKVLMEFSNLEEDKALEEFRKDEYSFCGLFKESSIKEYFNKIIRSIWSYKQKT